MAAPIGPGDWVECVSAGDRLGVLQRGSIYQISQVKSCAESAFCNHDGCTDPGLILRGRSELFCPHRFRPIYRPNAEFIESLKAPPQSVPDQPTVPSRTPEVVGAWSREASK